MAENGSTFTVTDENFASEIEGTNGLSMVDFWAAWCGPCRMVAPIVEQIATEYEGQIRVGKLDVDANQRTAVRFNVRSIPSIPWGPPKPRNAVCEVLWVCATRPTARKAGIQ